MHRGLSLKLFGVDGERLPGDDTPVQDFVLASGPTFPSGTARGFLRDGSVIGKAAALPEGVKSAVSSFARNLNRVVGGASGMADFFGHPFGHPLADPCYSQAPLRWGDHVAKLAAFPASPEQAALADWRLDLHEDEDGFRHVTVRHFAAHDVVFELRAQPWTDPASQPIEDASVEWEEADSPFRPIATIRLPRQDACSPTRVACFDERLTFRPSRGLAAHRPLGSVMRARAQVYAASRAVRQQDNGVSPAALLSIGDIPG